MISCSTKVCSFGKQVVEKVETEYSRPEHEPSRFVYRINRSPMCEYMINFIQKLKHLPERYMMNSVLENFTILQVSNRNNYWRISQLGAASINIYNKNNFAGCVKQRNAGDSIVYSLRVWGGRIELWRPASHLPLDKGLAFSQQQRRQPQ